MRCYQKYGGRSWYSHGPVRSCPLPAWDTNASKRQMLNNLAKLRSHHIYRAGVGTGRGWPPAKQGTGSRDEKQWSPQDGQDVQIDDNSSHECPMHCHCSRSGTEQHSAHARLGRHVHCLWNRNQFGFNFVPQDASWQLEKDTQSDRPTRSENFVQFVPCSVSFLFGNFHDDAETSDCRH